MTRMAESSSGRTAIPIARTDGSAERLEVDEHVVLVAGVVDRLLLERIGRLVGDDEPDEVARRADRQVAQDHPVRVPVVQRQLPGQGQQLLRGDPESQVRKGLAVLRAQRRFRR